MDNLRVKRIAVFAGSLMLAVMLALGATALGPVPPRVVSADSSVCSGPTASPSPTPSPSTSSGARTSPSPSPPPFVGIAATPSTELANGQYVKITFCNVMPGEAMVFRQCIINFNPANLNTTDCNRLNTFILGRADANGSGSVFFPTYANGDDMLETPASFAARNASTANPPPDKIKIPCDLQHDCVLVAKTSFQHTYVARLSFAPNPNACPPESANAVNGSGSAAATRALYLWTGTTCLPPKSLSTSYITHSEHDAYVDFFRGPQASTDFGVTGLGESPPAGSTSPSYKLAPLTASGVVLAYRAVDNRETQITNLTLTPDIIAGLYMGTIVNFSVTPAITALNPGINFPSRSQIGARADHNSETYIFLKWLAAAAPNVWNPPPTDSPDLFPTITALDLKSGERATATEVLNPPGSLNSFNRDIFYMGVMDSSTAAYYGLPTAKIKMPDGSVVSANSDSIDRAINDSTLAADGTLVPQWNNTADQKAYPMPMVTYMVTPTNTIDPGKGDTLAKFLRYDVQDGQTLLREVDGYANLPPNLVQMSLAVADQIPLPVPTPSPTPTPSPSPSSDTLPPLPSGPVETPPLSSSGTTVGASSSRTGSTAASNSRIAAITYSQGLQLSAFAHDELGLPTKYVLPSLLGLTLLVIGGGLGLQLWPRRRPLGAGEPGT